MCKYSKSILVSALLLAYLGKAQAGENTTIKAFSTWPQWRGPQQDGHAHDARVPLEWGPAQNLKWQTDLPGVGNSSPIVWGDRLFLTSATKTGSERWVLCIDRDSGKILWKQTAAQNLPPEPTHAWNTHASSTCVTDGQRVYAFFGTPGVFCYDFAGKLLWQKSFGPLVAATGWGAGAASPVLFEDLVIVNGDHGANQSQKDERGKDYGDSYLWALNKHTGEVVWKTRRNQGMGWGTPILWTNNRRQELVLNGMLGVWSYDPRTGIELWHVSGRTPDEGFGEVTPVWNRELLIVFTGKPGPAWAIRPGGSGDVGKSHVVWRIQRKDRDVSSPLLMGEHIYTLSRIGMATCLEAKTGKEVWRERLTGQPCASLLGLAGKLLFLSEEGTGFVVEPGKAFKLLHKNQLGDGDAFRASPAVADGQLFLRSDRRLYCLAKAQAKEPEVRTLKGHQSSVMAVAFSPDGELLASGSRDSTIKLWEPTSGKLLHTLTEHKSHVYSVGFSPKGDLLASGGGDKSVKLWDPRTGRVLRSFLGHGDIVRAVAFAPDQKTLASAGVDKTLRVWDVATGALQMTMTGHTARVMSVEFSPDGTTLLTASSDKTARLWDARTGRLLRGLEGHTGGLEKAVFAPDGQTIASSSQDSTVRLWDAATGKVLHVLEGHQGEIDSVAFAPDGKTLASGCKDKTIKLWDAKTGKLRQTLTGPQARLEAVTFSPDGRLLATSSSGPESMIWLWPMKTTAK